MELQEEPVHGRGVRQQAPVVDIDARFREELRHLLPCHPQPSHVPSREREAPSRVILRGNPMLVAVATALLAKHSPRTVIVADIDVAAESISTDTGIAGTDAGIVVTLMSMESYGSAFLAAFLEDQDPPPSPVLLSTIPETLIIAFAREHGMPIVLEEKSDVRIMLDRIAAQQPQAYFALAKSAQRLRDNMEVLRKSETKRNKGSLAPLGTATDHRTP